MNNRIAFKFIIIKTSGCRILIGIMLRSLFGEKKVSEFGVSMKNLSI